MEKNIEEIAKEIYEWVHEENHIFDLFAEYFNNKKDEINRS